MASEEIQEKSFKRGDLVKIKQPLTKEEFKASYWSVQGKDTMNNTVGKIGVVGDDLYVTHPSIVNLYWVKVNNKWHWYDVGILKRGFKGQLKRQQEEEALKPKPERRRGSKKK